MTKSEFIEKLASQSPNLPTADVPLVVNILLKCMGAALENGERIEIRGFGSFSLRHLSERQGRNPKTGEIVQVLPLSTVHFKPGLELRERVNNFANRISPA